MINTSSQLNAALNRFRVSITDLQAILQRALLRGADYADLYFEHEHARQISLSDNTVNALSNNLDFGAGVRVIKDEQAGYSYTENVTLDSLMEAATSASFIVDSSLKTKVAPLSAKPSKNDFYPMQKHWDSLLVETKKEKLDQLNDRIFSLDARVKKVRIFETDAVATILFANTEGCLFTDTIPLGILGASIVMEENGTFEQGTCSRSFRMGAEMITDELLEEIAQTVIKQTAFLFTAKQPKGGEMPVVMGAGASGILLHEAIGHAFEADFIRNKTSIFTGQLGQQICDEHINVVDDATLMNNRGAVNIDDEGIEGQKTYIVKEGRLNSFLHDRLSAKHDHVAPTGNGRRESFRCMPMPRMRATYMENGPYKEADIIASVKKGIYVDTFSNGQVQIGAGDFTFYVKSGYLIENGQLTTPVKDINIIGNGPQALKDIAMVGHNYKMDNSTWTCGKNGQACPVTCGMPSVLVQKLTVGGNA